MQADITISVIDSGLRSSQWLTMPDHEEIREELIRQIDVGLVKQVDVARALNIAPARVAEMRNRKRRVQQNELTPLAQLLGMVGPQPDEKRIEKTYRLRNLGRVAQGVWLEQSFDDPDNEEYVDYDRMVGDPGADELFAVTPAGASMNLLFSPGMQLICRRVPFSAVSFKHNDLVIAERSAHDLRETTCKRLIIDEEGVFWLKSHSDQPQFQEPWRIGKPDNGHFVDTEVRIIAKVLRGVTVFSHD